MSTSNPTTKSPRRTDLDRGHHPKSTSHLVLVLSEAVLVLVIALVTIARRDVRLNAPDVIIESDATTLTLMTATDSITSTSTAASG